MQDFLTSVKDPLRLLGLVQDLQEKSNETQSKNEKFLNKKDTCLSFFNFQFTFVKIFKISLKIKGASLYSLLLTNPNA